MSPKGERWLFFLVQLGYPTVYRQCSRHPPIHIHAQGAWVLLGSHLCVGLGHLLIQGLVVVDRQLQVLHLGWQATFAAHLAPGVHSRQELEGDGSWVSVGALGVGNGHIMWAPSDTFGRSIRISGSLQRPLQRVEFFL